MSRSFGISEGFTQSRHFVAIGDALRKRQGNYRIFATSTVKPLLLSYDILSDFAT